MRTNEPRKRTDYAEIARQSVRRDFMPRQREQKQTNEPPAEGAQRRVAMLGENSEYYKFRHLIVGKLVRLVEQSYSGDWVCEFVNESDRQALNRAAGWTTKTQYIFGNVKFK